MSKLLVSAFVGMLLVVAGGTALALNSDMLFPTDSSPSCCSQKNKLDATVVSSDEQSPCCAGQSEYCPGTCHGEMTSENECSAENCNKESGTPSCCQDGKNSKNKK